MKGCSSQAPSQTQIGSTNQLKTGWLTGCMRPASNSCAVHPAPEEENKIRMNYYVYHSQSCGCGPWQRSQLFFGPWWLKGSHHCSRVWWHDLIDIFDFFAVVKQNFAMSCNKNCYHHFTLCDFIYRYLFNGWWPHIFFFLTIICNNSAKNIKNLSVRNFWICIYKHT